MLMSSELEAVRAKVDVRLSSPEERQERQEQLAAFVRYCIFRIERELGAADHWIVTILASPVGYEVTVAVRSSDRELERTESATDAPLATWSAMCRVEEALRACAERK